MEKEQNKQNSDLYNKNRNTYNQKYIPLIALVVAVVMMASFVVALLKFSNGSSDGLLDKSSDESLLSSFVEESDENSTEISVPDVVVPEKPKDTQYYHAFTFSDIEIKNSEIGDGTLAVLNSDNKYFATVNKDKLKNIYANMTPKKYGLSGVALDIHEDAFKNFDNLFVKYADTMTSDSVLIQKAYVDKKDGVSSNGSLELSTGYSLEIGNFSSDKSGFLAEQAYRYGIIQRYPEGKNVYTGYTDGLGLFRYVGFGHSYYMNYYKFCLEEYLDKLRTEKVIEFKSGIESNTFYVIYYVPADTASNVTKVPVPTNAGYTYEVSGDGTKGFVVSVKIPIK